jgi:hypothetical protein
MLRGQCRGLAWLAAPETSVPYMLHGDLTVSELRRDHRPGGSVGHQAATIAYTPWTDQVPTIVLRAFDLQNWI